MNELIHIMEHTLGLCGEKHISILGILEWPNFNFIFNYIKYIKK
jgi:hypothetical protein